MGVLRKSAIAVLCFAASLNAADFSFDSAGVRIHYIVEGKGEPVILIHGFAGSVADWTQSGVIRNLADSYQVIAIDNRGHGQSEKPHDPDAYGVQMTGDVLRLMDHLKIGTAHIVGYSMGGFMTEILLTEHPDRFLTATLGGAGWSDPQDGTMNTVLNQVADSLDQGKGIGPLILALNPPGAPAPSPQQVAAINELFLAGKDTQALAAVARGQTHFPPVTEAQLRANRIPVLALIGELDPLKAGVDRFNGVMPHVKIVVIPGANHLTAFGTPLFVSSLKSFLADHPF